MLVMSLSPLLGAPSPAESPPDFSKDLPTFLQECSFYLRKTIFSGPPEDLPTFRVTRRGWEASVPQKIIMYSLPATVATTIASRQACQTICGLPAVIAVMRDYKLPIYSCARRFVRSTLNLDTYFLF